MMKTLLGILCALALASTATAQDAKATIAAASKAMGTPKTLVYSASGDDFALGQAYNPNSPWPRFTVKSYTRMIDYGVPSSRADRVRMQFENPPRGGGQQPVRGEQQQSQTVVLGSDTPWPQQLEIWMTPHGYLAAATANNATASSKTVNGKRFTVLSFKGKNGAAVNGYVNDQQMVERVETWIDSPLLGDMLFDATYTEYKDFGGVKFPTKIVQTQGGYPILNLTVSDVKPNTPVSIQPPAAPAPAAAGTPSQKLADGVYLILGGYASLAIDFKDYIVMLEGPQSVERAEAVIAEAKRLIPNKPIRYVVNTHNHIDHSSGIRPFIAEGATIVTHEINKPYFEKIATLPHTLSPDRQATAKRKPVFETMTEKKVLTDGNHVIELHHLQGNGHNEGLIVAYLPKEKILYEADAFNPPAQPTAPPPTPLSPYTANLVANIDRLKLDVDTIIPVHYPADGRVVKKEELTRTVSVGK